MPVISEELIIPFTIGESESEYLVLYGLAPVGQVQSWENLQTRFGKTNKNYSPPERTVPYPVSAKLIYVEAETEQEAAEAVSSAYRGANNGAVLVIPASKVTSVAP